MVNCLKKITFFYLICFLGITAIFCLYYKKNKIEVKMSSYNEEIVFFDYDGKIEGMYLEANKPIEDVFLYYTIKHVIKCMYPYLHFIVLSIFQSFFQHLSDLLPLHHHFFQYYPNKMPHNTLDFF